MSTVYTLVVPKTWRSGPGHRSHLSPRKGVTLCGVEKNVPRGMAPLFPHQIAPSSDVERLRREANRYSCRRLCANCYSMATRSEEKKPKEGER